MNFVKKCKIKNSFSGYHKHPISELKKIRPITAVILLEIRIEFCYKAEHEKEDVMETKSGGEGLDNLNPKSEESILACSIKPEIQNMNLLSDQKEKNTQLAGVFCKGVQYFDLKNIDFINNSDLANLIDILKSMLKQGIALQFVNVNKKIKEKIRTMGLENILNCGK